MRTIEKFLNKKFITNTPFQTKKIGEGFAKIILSNFPAPKAVVLALKGELGSGKTTFLKGFAKGLGIKETIQSPTFIIIRKTPFSYCSSNSKKEAFFYHIDCYRLQHFEEIIRLGIKEIFSSSNNIVAIEWAEKIEKLLPLNVWHIYFKQPSFKTREIYFVFK